MTSLDTSPTALPVTDLEQWERETAEGTPLAVELAAEERPMPDDSPIWERLPGESDLFYRQFLSYRDQRRWMDGRPRTVNAVRIGLGLDEDSTPKLYAAARKFRWLERAVAWDDSERRMHESTRRDKEVKRLDRYYDTVDALQVTAGLAAAAAGRAYADHVAPSHAPISIRAANEAAKAAAQLLATAVRPSLPLSERAESPSVLIQQPGEVRQVIVDKSAAEAFIAAHQRMQDAEHPQPSKPDDLTVAVWQAAIPDADRLLIEAAIETTSTETDTAA